MNETLKNKLQEFAENKFLHSIYRFFKIIEYNILYKTFLYHLFYKTDINSVIDENIKYKLVITHNGGGGTLTYVKNKFCSEQNILILKKEKSADKDYLFSLENQDKNKKIFISSKKLFSLKIPISEIYIVSIESNMSFEQLFEWLLNFSVPITYDVHDFFCVWYEAHFIHNGKYLSKQEIENSVLKYGFTKFTFQKWNSIWKRFLEKVTQIVVFSLSSEKIFLDFFPECKGKTVIKPHSLDYINCEKLDAIPSKFCIGIFGNIQGADKGSLIVHSFLEYSKNKEYDVFINGKLEEKYNVFSKNIHYMGSYKIENLTKIIKEQGISSVFFPSICPETFSYTVSELMYVGVPVACFNFGAQEEKVSNYKYGEVIKDFDNDSILEALKKAHEKALQV